MANYKSGNSARWLNHSCAPNCETVDDNGRIFIETLRAIGPGEELFIDSLLDEDMRMQYMYRCAADRVPTVIAGRGSLNIRSNHASAASLSS